MFTDASFGNAPKDKSQLCYIVLLADKYYNSNIIHFASSRFRRVTRSVMAREIHALVLDFDAMFTLQHLI